MMGHEGVPEAAKVSTIPHFFREDVSGVEFASDVTNVDGAIADPFTNGVFMTFDVAGRFGGHVVGPIHTSRVVIVPDGGRPNICDGKA